MQHDNRYRWFDLVRGGSALAVCAGHLRAALLVPYGSLARPNLGLKALYFVTGLGHQAVMVFFVLSGFFVGGSVLKKGPGFSAGSYALARLTRLWVVLLPALVLTALVQGWLHARHPEALAGAYHGAWMSGPMSGVESNGWGDYLGNALFVQNILVPVVAVNGPLWSLANEFWYYALFPLACVGLGWAGARRSWAGRGAALGVVVIVLAWLPAGISAGWFVWLAGVAVWWLAGGGQRWPMWVAPMLTTAGGMAFVGALGFSKMAAGVAHPLAADAGVGISFAVLALGLTQLPWPGVGGDLLGRAAERLSDFSYSLYLVHFPLVLGIAAAVYTGGSLRPDGRHVAEYLGWLAGLVACGWAFWWVFERRTDEVRRWIGEWQTKRLRRTMEPAAGFRN